MSFASPTDGLSVDQAPPLSIPASFFLLAPVAIGAGGLLLAWQGAAPLASSGLPGAGALTHLGTLGLLGSVMLGAVYQMAPVVAGARVPAVRLAHAVHACWTVGVAALVTGFLTGGRTAFLLAGVVLGVAALGFAGPVLFGLLRAPTRSWTARGMKIAVLAFLGVATLGLAFVSIRAGYSTVALVPGFDLLAWRAAHLGVGLTAWVGGLLVAVSWQVLPMFYLAPEVAPRWRATLGSAGAATLVLAPVALAFDLPRPALLATLAPAALGAWVAHPALVLPTLRQRQRKRRDETVRLWFLSLICAPLALTFAIAAGFLPDPRLGVAFAWMAVWGWAGLAMHGMLCRIVPFLVWFHRLSPLVGKVKVPPVRQLMPQDRIRTATVAHVLSLVLGLIAIGTGWDPLARLAGLALLATAALLGRNLVAVLRFRPE